jgi:hypothetical protein
MRPTPLPAHRCAIKVSTVAHRDHAGSPERPVRVSRPPPAIDGDFRPPPFSFPAETVHICCVIRNLIGVVLAVGTVTSGCGGGGGDSGPRGSQCRQIAQVYCNRAADPCQIIPPGQAVSNCIGAAVLSCCDGECGAAVTSTQAEIDTCIADIDAASCASLDVYTGGTFPASCLGVVQSAFALTGAASRLSGPASDAASHLGQLISR